LTAVYCTYIEADEAAIDWLTNIWLLAHDNNNNAKRWALFPSGCPWVDFDQSDFLEICGFGRSEP